VDLADGERVQLPRCGGYPFLSGQLHTIPTERAAHGGPGPGAASRPVGREAPDRSPPAAMADDFDPRQPLQQAWSAVDHPNPAELAAARRRWRAADEPGGAAKAAPAPSWPKDSYTYTTSAAPAPAPAPSGPAGMRSARVAETNTKPAHVVHDMEGLGDQVRGLKKELAAARAENRLLRVGKERTEAELRKAEYEGEQALRTGAIVDGSGVGGSRPEVRLLKQLKAKTRELQEELASKEAQIGELGGQAKGVRVRELEIQTKTYLEEARRLKEVSRLQAAEHERALASQADGHAAALAQAEGRLEDARRERQRLRDENAQLDEELGRWMDENEMLRDSVSRYEHSHEHTSPPSPYP
jgi:hypothetical protein